MVVTMPSTIGEQMQRALRARRAKNAPVLRVADRTLVMGGELRASAIGDGAAAQASSIATTEVANASRSFATNAREQTARSRRTMVRFSRSTMHGPEGLLPSSCLRFRCTHGIQRAIIVRARHGTIARQSVERALAFFVPQLAFNPISAFPHHP